MNSYPAFFYLPNQNFCRLLAVTETRAVVGGLKYLYVRK